MNKTKASNYRDVTPEQLTFLQLKLDWSDPDVRLHLALEGLALNILINDTSMKVRQAVAFQEYGLDILEKDPEKIIRVTVSMIRKEMIYQEAKNMTDDMFRDAGCL